MTRSLFQFLRAGHITAFNLAFSEDRAGFPPGGDGDLTGDGAPDPQDNNIIEYQVTWDNGTGQSRTFRGEVTSRAIPYSDVSIATGDSGAGLLLPTQALPPPC